MSNTFLHPVSSVETVNFTEALAQNAKSAMNNLLGMPLTAGRRYLIRALQVLAKENYGPELNFFGKAAGLTVDPATDFFISRFGFTSAMGEQLGAAGLWRYYNDGLAIPYMDLDWLNAASAGGPNSAVAPPSLHVVLQNIDTIAKSAAAAGNTQVTVWLEPMQAW
jgi:hypothetical protein